jgi:tetratricopeptide (TPR) repeat protein
MARDLRDPVRPPTEERNPVDRSEVLRAALGRLQAGAFGEAARLVEPLYHRRADDLEVSLLLGLAVGGCGHPDLAADLLADVTRRRPDARHPAHDLIQLLAAAKRTDAIAAYLAAAMALAPQDAKLLFAAGSWAQETGDGPRAQLLLERAIALQPDLWAAHVGLAAVLADAGQIDPAMARLRSVVASGGGRAAAFGNLAVLLGVEGRFEEAFDEFVQARRLAPNHARIAINHGMALLKAGRLAEGWPDLNRRLGLAGHALLPLHSLLPPLASGVRLEGRVVLVTHDEGLGDTIQFARYLPMLAAAGARVLLWVPKSLHRLLATVEGVAEVFSGDRAWPDFDWHCPIMRLAEVFGTRLETIPADVPYLRADPELVAQWAQSLPSPQDGRRIGLAWAGSARDRDPQLAAIDQRRSVDPRELAPMLEVCGVRWVSLQMGRSASGFGICDPMGEVRNLADTAAIIASLEAVVSVDTSVAHLAGAMGVPVYLLDRYDNCWRWLSGRDDSPWYPTLRIYRQPVWGDWSTPIRRVAAALSRGGGD